MATTSDSKPVGLLQPGQIIRPFVKADDVPALVSKLFGLTVTSVKELNSYDDRNFLIQVESKVDNPHISDVWPDGYVLKVLNSMDTKNETLVAAQNQMMLFLHDRGFHVSRPMKNVHGTYKILQKLNIPPDEFVKNNVSEEPSGEYMVRLLTFVKGSIFHDVAYTPELLYQCGVYIGKLDNELKGFQNEDLKSRHLIWMLKNTPELSKFVFAVRDEGQHKMILEILEAWQSNVIPVMPQLEKGMIHGDFNDQNIIVRSEDGKTFNLHGLIDFGDIQFSCFVFEIAITIMYVMVEVNVMDPNEAGGHVLAGYLTQRNVSDTEFQILKECVAARFAQSLVMGLYSIEQDPGNNYLIVTAARGWKVLQDFWNTPKEQILNRWKEIIKSYQH